MPIAEAGAASMRLIVVDDDDVNRHGMAGLLRASHGIEVVATLNHDAQFRHGVTDSIRRVRCAQERQPVELTADKWRDRDLVTAHPYSTSGETARPAHAGEWAGPFRASPRRRSCGRDQPVMIEAPKSESIAWISVNPPVWKAVSVSPLLLDQE